MADPSVVQAAYEHAKWRSICRLATTFTFVELFRKYGDDKVQDMINTGNLEGLRKWARTVQHGGLSEKSVAELRVIASKHKIKHYGALTKVELLRHFTRLGVTNEG